jgi:glycosyltransferase involved in cell wall biosynthesis
MKYQKFAEKLRSLSILDISERFAKAKDFTHSESIKALSQSALPKGGTPAGTLIRRSQSINPEITIIIPCYNTSSYIEQCLTSVCAQTLQKIEIILVDDASSDDTVKKILPFTYKDKRITLITLSQQSGSPGRARNIGLSLATAPYVAFLDSDDWLEPDMLHNLNESAKRANADICFLSGFVNHHNDDIKKRYYKKLSINSDGKLRGFHESFMLWDKLWKTDFLRKNNLEIAHTSASEELIFIIKAYYLAERSSVSTGNYGYNYRRLNPSSITTNIRKNVYPSFEFEAWKLVDDWTAGTAISKTYKAIIALRKGLSFHYALSIVNDMHRQQFIRETSEYMSGVITPEVLSLASDLGYESQIVELGEQLATSGNKNYKATPNKTTRNIIFGPDWSSSNPYQKLLYASLRKVYNVYSTGFSPKQLSKEYLLAKRPGSSILHLHWLHPFYDANDNVSTTNFIDILEYAKELDFTLVWTAHNIMPHEMSTATEPNHLRVRQSVIKLCDQILVHDVRAGEALITKFGVSQEKISVAPHGLYEKTMQSKPELKTKVKTALQIEPSRFTVLLAGRIRGYKGIERAINIFTKGTLNLLSNTTLVIAGYPDDDAIDSLILKAAQEFSDIKYVRGTISDHDLETLFVSADACLLPYEKSATSGLAFLSLSYNTPLITSKLPAFEQFVDRGVAICAEGDSGIEQAVSYVADAFYAGNIRNVFDSLSGNNLEDLKWDSIVKLPAFKQFFVN